MLQAGAEVAEHLRLVRQLGSGGMGSVWVAEQTRLGGQVAVKFLSTALLDHESARSRFDREARLVAKIKSQHVVQVHDHGVTKTDPSIPYIVMELLEGTDLSKLLDRDGPVGLTKAAEVIDQICDALTKAHDAGIVHRDIKPENVFILNESRTFIKLLDFGVAHGKDGALDRLTQTGLLLGTAHYMSPEQLFSGKDIDARADLWALGILSYQMLANEVPFQAETFGQLCLRVRDGSFPALSTKVNVPTGVDEWFTKALSTDRTTRFQSATEMAEAFRRVVAGESLAALTGSAASAEPTAQTSQTTGTGTVRVDKSQVSRVLEAARGADAAHVSLEDPSPATQRFGSRSEGASRALQQGSSGDPFVAHGTSSTGEQAGASVTSSVDKPARSINTSLIATNTPLADLSGSFGTEAKSVLALGPRASEPNERTFKWIGWLLVAAALGAAALYFLGGPEDTSAARAATEPEGQVGTNAPAAAVIGAQVIGAQVIGAEVIGAEVGAEVIGANDPQSMPVPRVEERPDAPDAHDSRPAPLPAEKAEPSGNPASTVSQNALTGRKLLATTAAPAPSGSPTSAAPQRPKKNGSSGPAKSNDHASSDKPSILQPALEHNQPPKPEPAPSRKPKYRGF